MSQLDPPDLGTFGWNSKGGIDTHGQTVVQASESPPRGGPDIGLPLPCAIEASKCTCPEGYQVGSCIAVRNPITGKCQTTVICIKTPILS